MKKLMMFLVFLLIIPLGFALSDSKSQVGTKGSFLQLSYQLLANTNFGWNTTQERAAWVVRGSDGTLQWTEWNYKEGDRLSTWNKPVPQGVIAQVHTHPALSNPEPSNHDVITAKDLKIPVYTITGSGIWRVAANGEITKEADENWYHNIKKISPNVEVTTHIEGQNQ